MNEMEMNEVIIYKTPDKQTQIEVKFEGDTVWLSQQQLATLFKQTKQNISLHINNCFKEKELHKSLVVKESLTTAADGKKYKVKYYNLDVIISVGYRVKSTRGTQFRQWATQKLREHFVQGYTVNQMRLKQLQQTIQLIEKGGKAETLSLTEAKGLLEIIANYTQSFVLLNQFDSQKLTTEKLNENITYEIQYDEAIKAIAELKKQLIARKEASELFGNQKDDSFAGILGSIVQTFGGEYLYKSIEEQAAHLLYFVIKNHPFSDGNKRIGAFLFIWFLEKNRHRFKKSGELKINDNGLVALALLVAQSDPADKELMIALIINLINSR
jgi:death-on-curing family protein